MRVDLVRLDLITVDLVGHIHYFHTQTPHIHTNKYTYTHTLSLSLQHNTLQRSYDLQQLMTWPWNLGVCGQLDDSSTWL